MRARQLVIRERFGVFSLIAGDPQDDGGGGAIRATGATIESLLTKALNARGISARDRQASIAVAAEILDTIIGPKREDA